MDTRSMRAQMDYPPPVHALTRGTGHHIKALWDLLCCSKFLSLFLLIGRKHFISLFFLFFFNNLFLLVFHTGLDDELFLHISACFSISLDV